MCLRMLDKKVRARYGARRSGYKVFRLATFDSKDVGLYATDQGSRGNKPRGEWLDEGDYRSAESPYNGYPRYRLGFHVCLTRRGAGAWAGLVRRNGSHCKVVKVTFKYPTAWGWQYLSMHSYPMVVAKQIMIGEDA